MGTCSIWRTSRKSTKTNYNYILSLRPGVAKLPDNPSQFSNFSRLNTYLTLDLPDKMTDLAR